MADKQIAGGAWVKIVADGNQLGLVSGASYDEDFVVTPANVIGYLGPVDYDCQGYTCSVTMQFFVPYSVLQNPGGRGLPDGGNTTITDLLPNRQSLQAQGGKPQQINDLIFVSILNDEVLTSFRNVMIGSNGSQISPNSYVTGNIRMLAVERV